MDGRVGVGSNTSVSYTSDVEYRVERRVGVGVGVGVAVGSNAYVSVSCISDVGYKVERRVGVCVGGVGCGVGPFPHLSKPTASAWPSTQSCFTPAQHL